jgi:hypothetical protein
MHDARQGAHRHAGAHAAQARTSWWCFLALASSPLCRSKQLRYRSVSSSVRARTHKTMSALIEGAAHCGGSCLLASYAPQPSETPRLLAPQDSTPRQGTSARTTAARLKRKRKR